MYFCKVYLKIYFMDKQLITTEDDITIGIVPIYKWLLT